MLFDAHGARACINDLPPFFGNMACCFPFIAAMHESGYASIVSVSDWNTLGRIVVPPRISHIADNGQRLYGTNAGCVYELQMLKDVAPNIAACDARCIRTLPPDIAWAVASGIDMLMSCPLFSSTMHDDSQFVASLQEAQRCVERLQSLASFVCNVQSAQGIACADRAAIDTEIERAVHMASHDHLMQQLLIRHSRDDALIAEAASFFLSMDPEDMGVAAQHAAAVRDAVAFSMHRKHRSLNRRRSSIDALSMLSRGDNASPDTLSVLLMRENFDDNVCPSLANADQDGPVPADNDQDLSHVDLDSLQCVDSEQEGNFGSDHVDSVAVKPSHRVMFEEDNCPREGAVQLNESQKQQQRECDNESKSLDPNTLRDERPFSGSSSSLFLPIDILSVGSSGSVGAGSLRSSPNNEGIAHIDIVSSETASAAVSDQSPKIKKRVATGTAGGADGRRGSVDFDSESFLSMGGGGQFSFIDLSESAQVRITIVNVICNTSDDLNAGYFKRCGSFAFSGLSALGS